jgi:hypothetical protein
MSLSQTRVYMICMIPCSTTAVLPSSRCCEEGHVEVSSYDRQAGRPVEARFARGGALFLAAAAAAAGGVPGGVLHAAAVAAVGGEGVAVGELTLSPSAASARPGGGGGDGEEERTIGRCLAEPRAPSGPPAPAVTGSRAELRAVCVESSSMVPRRIDSGDAAARELPRRPPTPMSARICSVCCAIPSSRVFCASSTSLASASRISSATRVTWSLRRQRTSCVHIQNWSLVPIASTITCTHGEPGLPFTRN